MRVRRNAPAGRLHGEECGNARIQNQKCGEVCAHILSTKKLCCLAQQDRCVYTLHMDSIRKKPVKKYLPPILDTPPIMSKRTSRDSFSHSFSLPPQPSGRVPRFSRPTVRTTHSHASQKKRVRKIIPFLCIVVLAGGIFVSGAIFWRASQVSNTTFVKDHSGNLLTQAAKQVFIGTKEADRTPLRGEKDGRVNILLLGKGGKNYPGQNLTDTIMVASIDMQRKQVALISLPRDLYVDIPDTNAKTKLNALYLYGQKNEKDPFAIIRSAIERITGLSVHYSLAVDYDGFVRIVDALGGINVTVPQDFDDPRYPGPNYSYEHFVLTKGFHTLDGATALKYVRERHDDPRGDFGRAERQQQVIQAVKNKAFTIGTILNPLTVYSLLGTVEDNVRTDFSVQDIESFLSLVQKIDTQNIHTYVVDAWKKESLLRVTHISLDNGQNMFALVPRAGTYEEIRTVAKNIFSQDDTGAREEKIREEKPVVLIVNTMQSTVAANNIRDLLSDLGFENSILVSLPNGEIPAQTYVKKITDVKKPYSLDEIIKKIPAQLAGNSLDDYLPKKLPEGTDFAIVLGNDSVQNYQWEKRSTEEYLQEETEFSLSHNSSKETL